MKYLCYTICIVIAPSMIFAMDRQQKQELKQRKANQTQQLWANPKDVVHGIYLAEVINVPRVPMRISEIDFTLVETPDELKAEIKDFNNITPRLVSSVKNFKSNTTTLRHTSTQESEVTCIKVEHLLYPKIFKIVTIVRSYENNICTIEALNDSEIIDSTQFNNYLELPKIVTRARITLNDKNFNDIEVVTNTFSCQ